MPRKRLRIVPARLKRMRHGVTPRWYARFYGNYVSTTGKRKRFSFQVKISRRLSQNRRTLARLIRSTCIALKYDRMVPEHIQGEIFPTFLTLLYRTPWFGIRRLMNYEPGVVYER